MGFQVCLCGTQPGYPHAADCPFPLYHSGEEAMARWDRERALLREVATPKLAAGPIDIEPEYADPLHDSERADWCAGGNE